METPKNSHQFTQVEARKLSEFINKVAPSLGWLGSMKEVDEELMSIWQEAPFPDLSGFKEELTRNLEWAAGRDQLPQLGEWFRPVISPLMDVRKECKSWIEANPNNPDLVSFASSNEMAFAIRNQQDHLSRVRNVVTQIYTACEAVRNTANECWRPYMSTFKTSPLHHKSETGTAGSMTGIKLGLNGEQLTQPQIAILYHVNGEEINLKNKNRIAREFGYIAENSGSKIRSQYDQMRDLGIRTGQAKNRLKDYENIEKLVSQDRRRVYEEEYREAKKKNKNPR
ncbi:hypothetical protein GGR92_005225 [Spirosoma lacussanchae]|uniref:hypothetical protein n=1 Tax=Spirosoma lacussanchae TaxID=1884249 RepID=UPI00110812FA|nr:hypothetical protein [Spirosoma lacussanchae]